jgi:hypothetical protein
MFLFEAFEQVEHLIDLFIEKGSLDTPTLQLRVQQVEVVAHTADFAVLNL